jgi:hypothetical protein
MNSSFREQEEPGTQQDSKRFLAGLTIFARIIERLAGLIKWTEEEKEEAGIYPDRLGGE